MSNASSKRRGIPSHIRIPAVPPLEMGHRHMPFPVTFLFHERRTRACWPFVDEPNDIPTTIQFQDSMASAVRIGNKNVKNVVASRITVYDTAENQGSSNVNTPGNPSGGLGAALSQPAYRWRMHESKAEDVSGIVKQAPSSAITSSKILINLIVIWHEQEIYKVFSIVE
jgi:hypothetical protein